MAKHPDGNPEPELVAAELPDGMAIVPVRNQYVDRIQSDFLDGLGTPTEIKQALVRSTNTKAMRMLELLVDPRSARVPMARLAKMAGLDTLDLLQIIRDHHLAEGMQVYLKGYQDVARDIVEDAKSQMVVCARCDGSGEITKKEVTKRCPSCKGTGEIRKPGDSDARKLMHESMGVVKKGGGIQINTVVAGGFKGVDCAVSDLEGLDVGFKNTQSAGDVVLDAEFTEGGS